MSFIPNIDADVKSPVEKSCNCCDAITCYFFCRTDKAKSPQHKVHRQVTAVSDIVFREKQEEKTPKKEINDFR